MKISGLSQLGLAIAAVISSTNAATVNPLPSLADTLNLASDTFAIQLVGAQSNLRGLESLCSTFDPTRLHASGYNVSSIHRIFCQAAFVTAQRGGGSAVPEFSEVQALTMEYSSYLWIFQALGTLKGDEGSLKGLCESIDEGSAFIMGLNGTLVKNTVCGAANGDSLPSVGVPVFSSGEDGEREARK
ncbi:MAG: hypothetical protein Q9220_000939 [cf. Caloplaca sp. 1 TL-2023]